MGAIDTIISIVIIITFIWIIGSKVYDHEKEHMDPFLNKIKGWLNPDKEEEMEGPLGPNDDFDISFKGQMQ